MVRISDGFIVAVCARMLLFGFLDDTYGLWIFNMMTLGLALWLSKRPPPQLAWPYLLLFWGSSCQCEALRDMMPLRSDVGSKSVQPHPPFPSVCDHTCSTNKVASRFSA